MRSTLAFGTLLPAAVLCTAASATAGAVPPNKTSPMLRATAAASAAEGHQVVRILHLSDTHNLHDTIEATFPMPPADILIHSGDLTDYGTDEELGSVNAWLGRLRGRYKHIIVITGNHEWIHPESLLGAATRDPNYWRSRLSHATVLLQEGVTVMGLKIFGSSWKAGQRHGSPSGFGELPNGVDILVTHGPPAGILDWCGDQHWGSSEELYGQVMRHGPAAHLFGHVHEQRGLWQRDHVGGNYTGGVEYRVPGSGKPFPTTGPPPSNYPSKLVSNNAMLNHVGLEGWAPKRIAGPARVITASMVNGAWQFRA